MTEQSHRNRILWAIDALETPGKLQVNAIATLRMLIRRNPAEIEPVYVVGQAPSVSPEFSYEWIPQSMRASESATARIVQAASLPNILPPRILVQTGASTLGAAEKLAAYASRCGATLIVANTHSKTGLKRFFLGSFAETLLLRSRVPVLVVGPHLSKPRGLRTILHPTDFTSRSLFTFKRVLELAEEQKARILLLHVIPFSMRPYTSANILFPGSYWGLYQDYMRAAIEEADACAHQWKEIAAKKNVRLDSIIDRRGLSIWESIIEFSKKRHADLIALESQTGPVTSAILGSTSRQVLRHAHCPVWTLHPSAHLKRETRARPRARSAQERVTPLRSGPRTKVVSRAA